ncbi:prephenate dehydrogenase [Ruminococcus flavefaciens]|uniref:Prephenate dehydrogenase n=1 Tax=Ruminococcus flavefaciens TaxID=1265 RepID=A0A315Y450_RUMFL|nr:prephenate dehydrogenase [Ruminococcus flavefaciens]PWJ15139.1 prephenate dehydrogenase [Ruminococcus flavefaciens]SSA40162.1 prephenate dehydrogenase [Ruminococcus flavefaciens]
MKILVVGLGLIGGSLCKALKKYTYHTVAGCDINRDIENAALRDVALDEVFDGNYEGYDLIVISLFPEGTERFFAENASKIGKNTLITDVCGIKGDFSQRMKKIAERNGLRYVGIHPMAGKEFGGYYNSTADLFVKANFIIAPFVDSQQSDIDLLNGLAKEVGAGKIVITSPENHDKMIAYTSQLAHIVSSAYVKSPELGLECGFSGGSFQDMTRIATMNEKMWTDLFMQNREHLQYELDTLIDNLKKYSEALKNGDADGMRALIAEGRELKEENLRHRVGQPN